jgi:pilus assembly protein CpaD
MDKTMTKIARLLGLCAMLAAASCASPASEVNAPKPDGAANHPITVEPSYKSLKVNFAPGGLSAGDAAQLDAFVADYIAHGSGSIAVSAPATSVARDALTYLADHINQMGISRDHILVATHDAPDSDQRVEVNYISYQAHTDKCGDWSDDLAFTMENDTPKNFGCSVQQNIAAMVANPRDLISPRDLGEDDAARRATVLGKYELGQITSAEKRKTDLGNEQSGLSAATQ